MTDVAVELRARAEKARAEANRSAASDGLLYAGLMVEARTYDEAASLVESSQEARDDLAELLERHAEKIEWLIRDDLRDDLREAAALARASAPSEGRVGGWEVRSEGMHGEPPHAIERGTGPDLEVFVTGIESYDDACKIEAALNEPAPPDPAPDRVAEQARHVYVPDTGEHEGHRVTRVGETERWAYSECECGTYWRYTCDAAEDQSREKHRWGEPATPDRVAEGTRGEPIYADAVEALRGDLTEIIEQDAAVGNHHTQVHAKQIVKKLDDALTDRPAPSDRVAEGAFARAVAAEIARARAKFPGNRHQYVALAEEVGEVAKALIEGESPEAIYAECVQVAAMAQRVAEDGDDDFPGYEPAPSDRVAEGTLCPTCKSDDPRYYCIPFIGKRHQGDPLVCDDSFHATASTGVREEGGLDP